VQLNWVSERHLRCIVERGGAGTAARAVRRAGIAGLVEATPAYETVVLEFDAARMETAKFEGQVRAALTSLREEVAVIPAVVEVPVCYQGEYAPDLEEVAREVGLSPADVVTLHSGADYLSMFLGFMPGFAYLDGLPPVLQVSRLDRPRTRVPAGSVGIAGGQAGVYPLASPGGWRLIGRTPRRIFDAARAAPALIAAGDRVKFVPIDATTFRELERQEAAAAIKPMAGGGRESLRVLEPGMLTTVQDLGRPGWADMGVVAGGAADSLSLRIGNRLVGNEAGAAGLEMTLAGGAFECIRDALVAVTGADVPVGVEGGAAVPMWKAVRLTKGDRLRIGRVQRGVRAYLCIAGGVDVPLVLGGRGTHLAAGFGGFEGRRLAKGDVLRIGEQIGTPRPLGVEEIEEIRRLLFRHELTCVPGPQFGEFAGEAWLWSEHRISVQSDRVGVRLQRAAGESLEGGKRERTGTGGRMVSEGVMWGAVQVPEDGSPIVLGVDHPTTGGYPVAAVVTAADLPALGQLAPGARIRLRLASVDEARGSAKRLSEI
jgi:KipI family sensor histidine kinase inhibitor